MENPRSKLRMVKPKVDYPHIGIPVKSNDPQHMDPSIHSVSNYVLKNGGAEGIDFNSKPVHEIMRNAPEGIRNKWETVCHMFTDPLVSLTLFVANVIEKNWDFFKCFRSEDEIYDFCSSLRACFSENASENQSDTPEIRHAHEFLEKNNFIGNRNGMVAIDRLEKLLLDDLDDDPIDDEIAVEVSMKHSDEIKSLGPDGIRKLKKYLRSRFIGVDLELNLTDLTPEIFAISKTVGLFINKLALDVRERILCTLHDSLSRMFSEIPEDEE